MQGNASSYSVKLTIVKNGFKDTKFIKRHLVTPDTNLIENVWLILKRDWRVAEKKCSLLTLNSIKTI